MHPFLDTSPIILGIDPGARQIGVSVFRGEELLYYAVKTFKKRSEEDTLRKLRKVLAKLIVEYRVRIVAIEEIILIQQRRSFVRTVCDEVRLFVKNQDVELSEYNPKLVRRTICRNEKPTKENTALILSQTYAELAPYFGMSKIWQKRYYALLFGAIAVGLVCAKELRKHTLPCDKNNQLNRNRH
jgi:Holliday junction resolvasome RuvABC endonuclease subunit